MLEVRDGETVLDAALRVHQPLASSCAGRAVCGDCKVRIVSGGEHAAPPDAEEQGYRTRRGETGPERLACCLRVNGPIDITTTYW